MMWSWPHWFVMLSHVLLIGVGGREVLRPCHGAWVKCSALRFILFSFIQLIVENKVFY
jgi:hypothetical protein